MSFPGGFGTFGSVSRYPAAGASTTIYREDLLDLAVNLDREKRAAVFLALPKTDANGLNHEWFIDQLIATSTAGAIEGDDWSSGAIQVRTRLANSVQTFRRNFAVTMDSVQYSLKGRAPSVTNEYEHQVENILFSVTQSIDARICALGTAVQGTGGPGNPPSATASNDTPLMLTLKGWMVTATAAAGTTTGSATATNSISMNVLGGWSRSRFLTLHQTMFSVGANPNTLAVDPQTKADITADVLGEVASNLSLQPANTSAIAATPQVIRQIHTDTSNTEFFQDIQFMRTDFGRIAILVDRFIPTAATATDARTSGAWFLFDRAKVRVAFWRPLRHYPLPPNGDAMRGYIHAGATLEVLHPQAIGIGYNMVP